MWQEKYVTCSLRSIMRYPSCHLTIKFISCDHCVIYSLYELQQNASNISLDVCCPAFYVFWDRESHCKSLKSIDIHHLKNTKLVKTYFPLPHTPVINTTTIMGDVPIWFLGWDVCWIKPLKIKMHIFNQFFTLEYFPSSCFKKPKWWIYKQLWI